MHQAVETIVGNLAVGWAFKAAIGSRWTVPDRFEITAADLREKTQQENVCQMGVGSVSHCLCEGCFEFVVWEADRPTTTIRILKFYES